MNDQQIEQEIQAKGLTAPRVTPADIEANISSEWYINAADGVVPDEFQPSVPANHPLRCLTFCVLVLKNGFTVTGESACVSPENFDAELGRKIARQNAMQKIWPLIGYALKERLAAEPADYMGRMRVENAQLNEKIEKLEVFMESDKFNTLEPEQKRLLQKQYGAMMDYLTILAARIGSM